MIKHSKKENYFIFLNYSKNRHLKLLKYYQYFKHQGKNLINESIQDYSELLSYSIVLNSQLESECSYYYVDLLY